MNSEETDREVRIPAGRDMLDAYLESPGSPKGLILFAHGSGSGRDSPRNQRVAHILRENGFATLLLDLLTSEEELIDLRTGVLRFDVPMLAERLVLASDWVAGNPDTMRLPLGYFGASTGAAAALMAAARQPDRIKAVVSRGGRPDLAMDVLDRVTAPTLLIVGQEDVSVLELNEEAYAKLRVEKKLQIVPGATHLFEEHGTLEEAAYHAVEWFEQHLTGSKAAAA